MCFTILVFPVNEIFDLKHQSSLNESPIWNIQYMKSSINSIHDHQISYTNYGLSKFRISPCGYYISRQVFVCTK